MLCVFEYDNLPKCTVKMLYDIVRTGGFRLMKDPLNTFTKKKTEIRGSSLYLQIFRFRQIVENAFAKSAFF
jgi:hypothetical protein